MGLSGVLDRGFEDDNAGSKEKMGMGAPRVEVLGSSLLAMGVPHGEMPGILPGPPRADMRPADYRIISRRSFVKELISHTIPAGSTPVLDIGTRDGGFLTMLHELGETAYGIDKDPTYAGGSEGVIHASWPEYEPETKLKMISLNEVIYYLLDLQVCLEKIRQFLIPGGILWVKYHNANVVREEDRLKIYGPTAVRYPGDNIAQSIRASGFEIFRVLPYPEDNYTMLKCYLSLYSNYMAERLRREATLAKHVILISRRF